MRTLTNQLQHIIEPDYGLLDQLVSRHVLTLDEIEELHSQIGVTRRCRMLLDRIIEKSDDDKVGQFMDALRETDQQHVVNAIRHKGGNRRT